MIVSALWVVATASVPVAAWALWRLARRSAHADIPRGRAVWLGAAVIGLAGVAMVAPVVGSGNAAVVRTLAQNAAMLGGVTSLVLLASAAAGEPARGRRRCPRCWYDMAGTPGLVCPECGADAGHEARLFRRRRRVRAFAAGTVPALIGASLGGLWLARQPSWVGAMPPVVLIAASPWQFPGDRMIKELMDRVDAEPMALLAWDRQLCAAVSHRVVATGEDPHRVLVHAWILMMLDEQDDATVKAVLALAKSTDDSVAVDAVRMLGFLGRATDEVERTLVELVAHEGRRVRDPALASLIAVKEQRPGGEPPASVVAIAADSGRGGRSVQMLACRVLRLCDPSEASRAALLTALNGDEWVRPTAMAALAQHYPQDPDIQDLLVRTLAGLGPSESGASLVRRVLEGDERNLAPDGGLTPARQAFYTDAVRAAMIDAANAAPADSPEWAIPRRLLRDHPCLTTAEHERLKAGTAREPWRGRVRLPPNLR